MNLCLWAGTLTGHDLWTRVRAAGAAGYTALSAAPCELVAAVAAGDERRLRAELAAHGVRLACLDPVPTWLPDAVPAHPAHRVHAGVSAAACLDLAERFCVPLVNAIDVTWRRLPAAAPYHLAAFADRARHRGVAVTVEPQVYSGVPTLAAASALRRHAPDTGLTVDAWHFFRDRTSGFADLAGERVGAVQLADGPARGGADAVAESIGARRMPGYGEFALPALLAALEAAEPLGAGAPVGPEVFAGVVPAHRVHAVAAAAFAATRGCLAAQSQTIVG